jgi:hypothetical protein
MTLTPNLLLLLPMALLAAPTSAQPPPPNTAPVQSALSQAFWGGLGQINMLFKGAGNLASGATHGAIWRLDLVTGNQHQVGSGDTLSWPVGATADGPVFALQGRQLVRFGADGTQALVSDGTWRKLLGVLPDGSVLGFVVAEPRARPALLSLDRTMRVLPAPETDEDRQREAFALQEERDYADDTHLRVRRSERGGQGFDVFLIKDGTQRNLTDCGSDRCGQPSLTDDGRALLYIRAKP